VRLGRKATGLLFLYGASETAGLPAHRIRKNILLKVSPHRGDHAMRKTPLFLCLTPFFLLTLLIATAGYTFACHCEDEDGDGYGAPGSTPVLCQYPDVDCDDTNPAVNPGATEGPYGSGVCSDGIDNNCRNGIDNLDPGCQQCSVDADCNDANPCTDDDCDAGFCAYTNNTAPCDDGNVCTSGDVCLDGGCSGVAFDLDQDGDGHVAEVCGGKDCNDSDPAVHPGVFEAPPDGPACTDGIDNNCNGYTDLEDAGCVAGVCSPASAADAAVYGTPSEQGSRLSTILFALLLPVGAVILVRRVFRKR